MSDAVAALRALAPPPVEPTGRGFDPGAVAAALGVAGLPAAYVAIAREWGSGSFGGFLSVYEPGHPNRFLDLLHQAPGWRDAMRTVHEQAPDELPRSPEIAPGGMLAWGADDNGDPCFWDLRDPDPERWGIVVVEARGPLFHVFDGGLAAFLVAVLARRERVVVFPDDFPTPDPGFRRY